MTINIEIEDFFHFRNWPKQLILSNHYDKNSYKTLIAYTKCIPNLTQKKIL